jgi:urease accessory protein
MDAREAISSPCGCWEGELELTYGLRERRSVLERRRHRGPLRVQRDLYPEGEGVCHTIVVHRNPSTSGVATLPS